MWVSGWPALGVTWTALGAILVVTCFWVLEAALSATFIALGVRLLGSLCLVGAGRNPELRWARDQGVVSALPALSAGCCLAERAAAGGARPTGSLESRDLAEFRKCHPPQFTGEADPEVADRWIRELEKIFNVLGCSPEKRLAYAMYMLVGEAEHWWRNTCQMLAARGVTVDWECFRTVFMEKYYLESVRHAKEAEFLQLHQGGLSVSEYALRFEHLARFYSQAISEAWKCRKFAEGLKYELKKVVVPMAITEFPALVEKAKIVERLEGSNRVIRAVEGPSGSKRGSGSQGKLYDRPQPQQRGPVIRQPAETARGGGQGGGAALRCYRCGGSHLIRDCPHTESRCFRCQQMGHVSFNCPTRSRLERSTQRSDAQRADTQRSNV
ncbi:uncharacterized protein LOC109790454 [Cajanus cajan]|uniref:uncharacterized protein LOC109790454 n=1 Tax=Cajanus cajan TaxID=3821 RepID=UPI00098D8AE6|nr:uncharacterized protein LOC109790454 [Cajanus cajan]